MRLALVACAHQFIFEVLWTVDDWITFPDQDFVLLQLHQVYDRFRNSHCVIPPAHGPSPGIASNKNGQPVVVGLEFAPEDGGAGAAGDKPRSVLLGDGGGQSLSIPKMFDNTQANLSPGLMFYSQNNNNNNSNVNTATTTASNAYNARDVPPPPPGSPPGVLSASSPSKRGGWVHQSFADQDKRIKPQTPLPTRRQGQSQVYAPATPLSPEQLSFRREEVKDRLRQLEELRPVSSQKDYEAQRAQLQATLENLDASGGNGGADPAALPSASSTASTAL